MKNTLREVQFVGRIRVQKRPVAAVHVGRMHSPEYISAMPEKMAVDTPVATDRMLRATKIKARANGDRVVYFDVEIRNRENLAEVLGIFHQQGWQAVPFG